MILIHWPVAGDVESRVAGAVLGEFVAPEVAIGGALRDPVSMKYILLVATGGEVNGYELVHECEQVMLSKRR